jgi:hypothetical protein
MNKYIFLFIIIIILIFLNINHIYFFYNESFDNTQPETTTETSNSTQSGTIAETTNPTQNGTIINTTNPTQTETETKKITVTIESETSTNLGYTPTIIFIIIFLSLMCSLMNYMVPKQATQSQSDFSSSPYPYVNPSYPQPIIIPMTFQTGYPPNINPYQQQQNMFPPQNMTGQNY